MKFVELKVYTAIWLNIDDKDDKETRKRDHNVETEMGKK